MKFKVAGPIQSVSFPFALGGIFLLVGLNNVLHHEMWRDELQAWLIARDSASLGTLFLENLAYEGHPGLWHLCLYAIARLSENPQFMQFFNVGIATATVYIFAKYSPFAPFQKILFAFGYFPLFEYGTISRSYSLNVLLMFVFAAIVSSSRPRKYLAIFPILGAIANVSAYSFIVANAIAVAIVLELILGQAVTDSAKSDLDDRTLEPFPRRFPISVWVGGIVFGLLDIAALVQLLPPADSGFAAGWYLVADGQQLMQTLAILGKALFPMPELAFHFWNTYLIDERILAIAFLPLLCGSILLLCAQRFPLLVYVLGLSGLLLFGYVKFLGSTRHHGHIFILFVVCLWIARRDRNERANSSETTRVWPLVRTGKFYDVAFNIVLVVHVIAGVYAVSMDWKYPFSMTHEAAQFLNDYLCENCTIAGDRDSVTSAISAYTGKQVYYPGHDRTGSFVIWDNHRTSLTADEVLIRVREETLRRGQTQAIAILNFPLERGRECQEVTHLRSFEGSLVADENIYLYVIDVQSET